MSCYMSGVHTHQELFTKTRKCITAWNILFILQRNWVLGYMQGSIYIVLHEDIKRTYLFFKFGDDFDIEKWIWVCSYSGFAWRKFVWCTSQLFIFLMRERKREWIRGILIISIFGLVFEIILRHVNRNVGADLLDSIYP